MNACAARTQFAGYKSIVHINIVPTINKYAADDFENLKKKNENSL